MKSRETEPKFIGNLYKSFFKLKSTNEAAKYLRDLCTIAELNAMAERLEVVRLLSEGKSYRQINKLTGASTTTVTRVAYWLHHGMGGYKLMLERIG
jgi:TrpR-related protein YerC/YecD